MFPFPDFNYMFLKGICYLFSVINTSEYEFNSRNGAETEPHDKTNWLTHLGVWVVLSIKLTIMSLIFWHICIIHNRNTMIYYTIPDV